MSHPLQTMAGTTMLPTPPFKARVPFLPAVGSVGSGLLQGEPLFLVSVLG